MARGILYRWLDGLFHGRKIIFKDFNWKLELEIIFKDYKPPHYLFQSKN